MTAMIVKMIILTLVLACVELASTSGMDIQSLLKDECIAQVKENDGVYWTSTFQERISLLLSPSKSKELRVTLQQGNIKASKIWSPPTALEQKWYRGDLILNTKPALVIEGKNISFDGFDSSTAKETKWDITLENVDYCTRCETGMPIIEAYSRLASPQVVIPRSGRDKEVLQVFPLKATRLMMTVGEVNVKLCLMDGSIVVKNSSDTDDCPPLKATTLSELHITFKNDTFEMGVEGEMAMFPLQPTGARNVKINREVNGSVFFIQHYNTSSSGTKSIMSLSSLSIVFLIVLFSPVGLI